MEKWWKHSRVTRRTSIWDDVCAVHWLGDTKFHRHRRELVNKHVSIKLRMKFFDAVVTPTILFGLHT